MPVRDWKCESCGYILEDIFFHKESELDLPDCPKCKKHAWKIMPPQSNFIMK